MTPNTLLAKSEGYKLIEGEYANLEKAYSEVEAAIRTAITQLGIELGLVRSNREYIAGIRRHLQEELPPEPDEDDLT